jgi:hypothetical protein
MTGAFILGGARTPVGRYGGSLSHMRVDDLLGTTMVAACERVGVELARVEDIVAGCVNPAHEGMGDIARWAALAAGFPDPVPAQTVNRFCASSLSGTISIAHAIRVFGNTLRPDPCHRAEPARSALWRPRCVRRVRPGSRARAREPGGRLASAPDAWRGSLFGLARALRPRAASPLRRV